MLSDLLEIQSQSFELRLGECTDSCELIEDLLPKLGLDCGLGGHSSSALLATPDASGGENLDEYLPKNEDTF